MTRENKVGLAVCGSFLCLVAVVAAVKLRQPAAPETPPTSPTLALAAAPAPNGDKAGPDSARPEASPAPAPDQAPSPPPSPHSVAAPPGPVEAPTLPVPPSAPPMSSHPTAPGGATQASGTDNGAAPPPALPGPPADSPAPALPDPPVPLPSPPGPSDPPPLAPPPPPDETKPGSPAPGANPYHKNDDGPRGSESPPGGDKWNSDRDSEKGVVHIPPSPAALPSPGGPPPLAPPPPPPGPDAPPSAPGGTNVQIPPAPPGDMTIQPPPASAVVPPAPGPTAVKIDPLPPPPDPAPKSNREIIIPASAAPPAAPPAPGGVIAATPASAGPPRSRPPALPGPQVDSWDERTYVCKPGDDFASICKREYNAEEFAAALQAYNRSHPRAPEALRRDGAIAPGDRIYIPPSAVLEKRHGDAITKPKPKPIAAGSAGGDFATVPTSFQAPADAPNGPTYKVPPGGETLAQIAYRLWHDANRWTDLAKLNRGVDTEKPLQAGTVLQLPAPPSGAPASAPPGPPAPPPPR